MDKIIFVESSDVADFPCDVLVLKYAQRFFGADDVIATLLTYKDVAPRPGKYVLRSTEGRIAPKHVLFIGVPQLSQFDYGQIREFANYSMQVLAQEMPNVKHIAMTIHGVGYGLDERESFLAQIAGLLDALRDGSVPPSLGRITIVERNHGRAIRLRSILEENLPTMPSTKHYSTEHVLAKTRIDAGVKSNTKPHVFVALPFTKEMEDVYTLGIQDLVNTAGYLCEGFDNVPYIGDILAHIRSRIETAIIVIADLTGSNANVYLEVGYAWGKGRPTLLLAKKGEELKFDVKGQRSIFYENITDLKKQLKSNIEMLLPPI